MARIITIISIFIVSAALFCAGYYTHAYRVGGLIEAEVAAEQTRQAVEDAIESYRKDVDAQVREVKAKAGVASANAKAKAERNPCPVPDAAISDELRSIFGSKDSGADSAKGKG